MRQVPQKETGKRREKLCKDSRRKGFHVLTYIVTQRCLTRSALKECMEDQVHSRLRTKVRLDDGNVRCPRTTYSADLMSIGYKTNINEPLI